ncbi:MAG: sulfotransferase, partial [Oleibacter sp.]|nr:sulfotransferase [Thalassolituus sp.]
CFKQYFADGLFFTYHQEELADIWNASDALITHWLTISPNHVHVLDYETLVAQPEKEIKTLLDFVGLDWHDACLNFHENTRAVRTTSALQVRQPLSSARIEQWRHYEEQLAPMRAKLNVSI